MRQGQEASQYETIGARESAILDWTIVPTFAVVQIKNGL